MPALRTRDTQSRSLEVTTDAPQPPTLMILSPTPRAFTFPVSHNLSSPDSPYSTPSSSPFEPDLNSLAISSSPSCTTPPPLMRTLSPISSFTSVSPSPTSITTSSLHSLRSPGSDVDRRPKKGDEDYIKRPENAFILFRRKCCEERQAADEEAAVVGLTKKQRQADLSKTISQQWKSLTAEERKYWEDLAKEKKKEHAQMFPGYVYRPQRIRDKDGKARNKKRKSKVDAESMSFIIAPPRQHGRSASAPTPPPTSYQSIQIPSLYSSSSQTSPSLLPMIRRRASANGDPEDIMANFDFAPSYEHHAPAFDLEQPNFQSSEFVRSMFNMPSNAGSLTISTEPSLLLPAHQIVSPSSSIGNSSSGPSSPVAGPYTPTQSLHPQSSFDCASDPHMHSELDMNMQSYAGYGWSIGSVWQDETDMGIVNNDFDLSSIPAIEIGGPKYGDVYTASPEAMRMGEYSNEYAQEYSNEYIGDYQDDFSGQYIEGYQSTESSLLGYDKIIGSPEQRF